MTSNPHNKVIADFEKLAVKVDKVPHCHNAQVVVSSSDNIEYRNITIAAQYTGQGTSVIPSVNLCMSEFLEKAPKCDTSINRFTDMPEPPKSLHIPVKGPSMIRRIINWFKR